MSKAIERVAKALQAQGSKDAVALSVAEKYVEAFGNIAQSGNTVLLPTNTGDVGSMVAQALAIFESISNKRHRGTETTQNAKTRGLGHLTEGTTNTDDEGHNQASY